MKKLIAITALTLMMGSVFAEDVKTIVYTPTPKMTCANCEKKIKSNVRFVKGTKKIETSLKDQTITITYDADKAKPADYVEALEKIGRKVEEVKPADGATKAVKK